MTRLICDNTLLNTFSEHNVLHELHLWLNANQAPEDLYMGAPITIVDSPDGRLICYMALVSDLNVDPPVLEARSCPLRVEPPAYWPGGE